MRHNVISICVYVYRIILGDTYVHNIYLDMLWCVLEVLGKKGFQHFNLSSGGLQCWVWREVSGRGAVEIELVMLESKLVPSIRNGSYQIHFRWMGDFKKMSTCKFTSSDAGNEAASSKKQWLKSLESTLLGQMATGACTGRLWWLWTGHGGGFDKKFIISRPYLEVWQCWFTRSVSFFCFLESEGLLRSDDQQEIHGKLPSTLQVSVRQPGDGTWQEACGLLLRKAWQTSMPSWMMFTKYEIHLTTV